MKRKIRQPESSCELGVEDRNGYIRIVIVTFAPKGIKMKTEVQLDLIEFEQDNLQYFYSPALDLIGYGNTGAEARESWETVLQEYLEYALNKKSLLNDLENHGWQIGKNNELKPPTFTWLLQNNDQLLEVYNNHNFKIITVPIDFPLEREFA